MMLAVEQKRHLHRITHEHRVIRLVYKKIRFLPVETPQVQVTIKRKHFSTRREVGLNYIQFMFSTAPIHAIYTWIQ